MSNNSESNIKSEQGKTSTFRKDYEPWFRKDYEVDGKVKKCIYDLSAQMIVAIQDKEQNKTPNSDASSGNKENKALSDLLKEKQDWRAEMLSKFSKELSTFLEQDIQKLKGDSDKEYKIEMNMACKKILPQRTAIKIGKHKVNYYSPVDNKDTVKERKQYFSRGNRNIVLTVTPNAGKESENSYKFCLYENKEDSQSKEQTLKSISELSTLLLAQLEALSLIKNKKERLISPFIGNVRDNGVKYEGVKEIEGKLYNILTGQKMKIVLSLSIYDDSIKNSSQEKATETETMNENVSKVAESKQEQVNESKTKKQDFKKNR